MEKKIEREKCVILVLYVYIENNYQNRIFNRVRYNYYNKKGRTLHHRVFFAPRTKLW